MPLYQKLGIGRNASAEEIKLAFRQHALRLHPDKNIENPDPDLEEEFKEISEAYSILSNPVKRKQYDNTGETKEFDSKQEAKGKVLDLVRQIIRADVKADFFKVAKQKIKDNMLKNRNLLQKSEGTRPKLQAIRDNILYKKAVAEVKDSPFWNLLEDEIKQFDDDVKCIKHEIEVGEEILRFLEDWSLNKPEPENYFP